VLVEQGRCYIKSEAVLRIATRLGMPLPLMAGLALLVPKFISDPVYDQVGLAGTLAGKLAASGRLCRM
jgi:predicted DCC family thiol-disulfide oxidoreductase YuxK